VEPTHLLFTLKLLHGTLQRSARLLSTLVRHQLEWSWCALSPLGALFIMAVA
jgi:hypothetical protein